VVVEGDPVDDGGDQSWVREHGSPFAEGQVGADSDAGAFLPFGDDLEQQFGAAGIDLDVAELVELCRLSAHGWVGGPCGGGLRAFVTSRRLGIVG
jgi:hypothetical protein